MKKNKNLKTVGLLLKDLAKYGKDQSNWDIICNVSDEDKCYVSNLEIDVDGNLRIILDDSEYDRGDCYTLDMLRDELKKHDMHKRVYLALDGMHMTWEDRLSCNKEYEEIGFDCIVIEQFEKQERSSGWLSESDKRYLAEIHKKEQHEQKFQRFVIFVLMVLLIFGSVYNVCAIISHTGTLWENILWCTICIILTIICSFTLFFDMKKH